MLTKMKRPGLHTTADLGLEHALPGEESKGGPTVAQVQRVGE